MQAGRRPKDDGSPGWNITCDPERKSLKQAMIAIVFTGIWIEAFLHLHIVRTKGAEEAAKVDRETYEGKLSGLGVVDQGIIESAKRFRLARKNLVHEKAHFDDGKALSAQDEADNAIWLIGSISNYFIT